MDANIQLADLLADYVSTDTAEIQRIVSGKKEFAELASGITEQVPKPGTYYKHQRFILRYMMMADRLLMVHDPGTGKTCSTVAVTEHFRRLYEAGKTRYKRAYILTKGKSTKLDIKNQIICKCTAGTYLTPMVVNATKEASRKSNITRELSKWYEIDTYRKFINSIIKPTTKTKRREGEKTHTITKEHPPLTEEEIIRRFSDTIIFVDEVHNLRGDNNMDLNLVGDEDEEEIDRRKTEAEIMNKVYRVLFDIFHKVPRCKVILASATPMINSVAEIGPIMNLILPLDLQFRPDFDFINATTEELEPYFRGRVSYVRGLDTGAVPVYEGQRIDATYEYKGQEVQLQTIVYDTHMQGIQAYGYKQASEATRSDFHSAERQATCFVFPDGSYGGNFPRARKSTVASGIGKYIQSPAPDRYVIGPEIRPYISNLENLQQLSSKYAAIIQLVSAEDRGTVFCYSDFMTGSGAIMLGMCFEAMGFQRYDETQSMFTVTGTTSLPPVCSGGEGPTRAPRISKAPRYALLTSESSDAKQHSMMEAFNSPENLHGEYIKVLIGSPVTRDGINLSHVVQVHIITPAWHQSGMYQALSRALRATSHVHLIEEAQQRARAEGRDPALATVEVKIYKHAAILAEDGVGSSIDLSMYEIAEGKDREIHRIFRIMKECAVDCQIHRARNIRNTDVDYSPTCDYELCNYPCIDPAPTELDYETYDVFYSDEVVDEVAALIKELFREVTSVKITELYERFGDRFRAKFIDMALQRIISDKEVIYDRFGYTSFLKEDNGTVFLVRDFPIADGQDEHYPVSYYTETNVAILPLTLAGYLARLQASEQQSMVEDLANIAPSDPNFNLVLDRFSLETKIQLLEQSIQQLLNDQGTDLANAIVTRFRGNVFTFYEPISEIQGFAQALANRGRGRGRKPRTDGGNTKQLVELAKKIMDQTTATAVQGEMVYLHNLYGQQEQRVSYATTTRANRAEGRLRLLKRSEGIGWRDVTIQEQPVYNAFIQKEIEQRKAPYEQMDIYGTMFGNVFRIRDKTGETAATGERDKHRGRRCENFLKKELVDYLWRFGIQPPVNPGESTNRSEIITKLINSMPDRAAEIPGYSDEKLMFYFRWDGKKKEYICPILEDHFRRNGLLYEDMPSTSTGPV